jgi:glycogen debranching enzyme
MSRSALWEAAVGVLRANDLGGRTKPAPRLYPHQWSWDSAFIAIGLAHVDPDRALSELESLFAAQWADGRVPHIVFDPAARGYFPGPDRWACATLADAAPRAPATSGLVQPPVHALAAWHIYQTTSDPATLRARFEALYPRLLAWHRYLATARDPEGSGLLTTYHPWESTDNSPRWDAPLANVEVGAVPPYERHDLKHVADPSERPTQAEYDRYLWLVESLKAARYDDATIRRAHPFLVKDVLFSAIFAAANEALGRIAEVAGAPDAARAEIGRWGRRAGAAVRRQIDAEQRLALDLDLRTGAPIRVRTCAGLAPLLVPSLERRTAGALVEQLTGPSFAGAPVLAFPVVPSAAPGSPGFRPRAYWRGPSWPVVNWLLWWGLRRQGYAEQAAALRGANLALLARPGARFSEYFEPYTGEQLGSSEQSWTAAVALDWLAHDESREGGPAAEAPRPVS